jgi:hypothetical protein
MKETLENLQNEREKDSIRLKETIEMSRLNIMELEMNIS